MKEKFVMHTFVCNIYPLDGKFGGFATFFRGQGGVAGRFLEYSR